MVSVFLPLLLVSCTREPTRPAVRHLVLVTLDTVRADHLSVYGYEAPTSPHLVAFSQQADRYTAAISSSPWTLPSHASMLTGLHPSQHGAVTVEPETGGDAWPLPESATTLAELLAAEGYQTAAFVANRGYLSPEYGLSQGFDTYEVISGDDKLTERAMQWLDEEAAPDRPVLLFINYMSAHRPYNLTPQPGWPSPEKPLLSPLNTLLSQQAQKQPLSPDTVALVKRQYDQGIVNVDAAFGALLEGLGERNMLTDSAVVVTADHGEAFGEHDVIEHGKDIYEPLVRVPLLIHRPGQTQPSIVDTPVSSAHLPGLLAADFPALRALPVPDMVLTENRYCRPKDRDILDGRFLRIRRAVYDWPLKRIFSSDGDDALFDVVTDPGELSPLSAEQLAASDALQQHLPVFVPPSDAPPEQDATEEALRALGYIE